MRASLTAVATINFFNLMFFALFVLYAVRSLHVGPGLLGLVLGAGAIGGVLGATVTRRLAARLGVGRTYTIGCPGLHRAAGPGPAGRPALSRSSWRCCSRAEFVSGFGVMMLDISIGAIFAAVIPDQLRSRVSGAFQAVNYGTRPLGALAGGVLGSLIGIRPTLWIAMVGATVRRSCGCCRPRCPGSGCQRPPPATARTAHRARQAATVTGPPRAASLAPATAPISRSHPGRPARAVSGSAARQR